MRLDRTLSLLFAALPWKADKNKIPILMYHSVTPFIGHTGHPYFCTEITPSTFDKQLKFLHENGFAVKRLSELPALAKNVNNSNQKYVIITFDDGYRDFYEYALPILKKYNMPATVFIPSGLVDKGDRTLEGKPLMSWKQIRECSRNGIEIGSHSLTHGLLVQLSKDELAKEVGESKREIESALQTEICSFSYPYKFPEENKAFVALLCGIMQDTGYKIGVTTRIGTVSANDDYMLLKRLPVNEFDDSEFFKTKLSGAYNWLYTFQFALKRIRSKISNK